MDKQKFWYVDNKALATGIAYMSDYDYKVEYIDNKRYYKFPKVDEVIICWDIMIKKHKSNKNRK